MNRHGAARRGRAARALAHGAAVAVCLAAALASLGGSPAATALAAAVPTVPAAGATVAASIGVAGSAGGSRSWAWPLAPPWRVLQSFEAPHTRYSAGHRGIDLATATGASVFAPVAGTVYFAGPVAGRPVITVQSADGLLVSLEPVLATLKTGDAVTRGGPIGTVAAGGHCDGVCVHLGVRVNGEYVSPLLYFGGVPRAVLLPIPGG